MNPFQQTNDGTLESLIPSQHVGLNDNNNTPRSSLLSPNHTINNNNDKVEDDERKKSHREIERLRRQEMSLLVASLHSILPSPYCKGKRSTSDHLEQAVNYIKDLENNVKDLNAKRDQLKSTQKSTHILKDGESSGCKLSPPGRGRVVILPSQGGLDIDITLDYDENGGFSLLNALRVVYDEGLTVVSYTSTNANGSILHQVVCENHGEFVDVHRLEQRLNGLLSI